MCPLKCEGSNATLIFFTSFSSIFSWTFVCTSTTEVLNILSIFYKAHTPHSQIPSAQCHFFPYFIRKIFSCLRRFMKFCIVNRWTEWFCAEENQLSKIYTREETKVVYDNFRRILFFLSLWIKVFDRAIDVFQSVNREYTGWIQTFLNFGIFSDLPWFFERCSWVWNGLFQAWNSGFVLIFFF